MAKSLADPEKHSTTSLVDEKMVTPSPASTSRSSALTGTMAPVASTTALVSAQQGTSASTVSRPQVTSGASLQSLVQGAVQSAMDGILSAIDNHISTALWQPPHTQPTQPIQQLAAASQPQGPTSISTQLGQNTTGEPTLWAPMLIKSRVISDLVG